MSPCLSRCYRRSCYWIRVSNKTTKLGGFRLSTRTIEAESKYYQSSNHNHSCPCYCSASALQYSIYRVYIYIPIPAMQTSHSCGLIPYYSASLCLFHVRFLASNSYLALLRWLDLLPILFGFVQREQVKRRSKRTLEHKRAFPPTLLKLKGPYLVGLDLADSIHMLRPLPSTDAPFDVEEDLYRA